MDEKYVKEISDSALHKLAKKMGVDITEEMNREQVEAAVLEQNKKGEKQIENDVSAKEQKGKADTKESKPDDYEKDMEKVAKETKEKEESEAKHYKDKGLVLLQYKAKGSITRHDKTWKNNVKATVPVAEARDLVENFKSRFVVLRGNIKKDSK